MRARNDEYLCRHTVMGHLRTWHMVTYALVCLQPFSFCQTFTLQVVSLIRPDPHSLQFKIAGGCAWCARLHFTICQPTDLRPTVIALRALHLPIVLWTFINQVLTHAARAARAKGSGNWLEQLWTLNARQRTRKGRCSVHCI